MRVLVWSCAALAVLTLSDGAAAQEEGRRAGFWWDLGLGYGWAHVSCDICRSDRDGAVSVSGALGGTINRQLRLGAELAGWTRSAGGVDEYLGAVSAAAVWYPRAGGSFYLKGGLGYVTYRIDDDEDALTTSGIGPQVGAGYEVYLGHGASLQPFFNFIITIPRGALHLNGDRQADGVSVSLLQLGVRATWH